MGEGGKGGAGGVALGFRVEVDGGERGGGVMKGGFEWGGGGGDVRLVMMGFPGVEALGREIVGFGVNGWLGCAELVWCGAVR